MCVNYGLGVGECLFMFFEIFWIVQERFQHRMGMMRLNFVISRGCILTKILLGESSMFSPLFRAMSHESHIIRPSHSFVLSITRGAGWMNCTRSLINDWHIRPVGIYIRSLFQQGLRVFQRVQNEEVLPQTARVQDTTCGL